MPERSPGSRVVRPSASQDADRERAGNFQPFGISERFCAVRHLPTGPEGEGRPHVEHSQCGATPHEIPRTSWSAIQFPWTLTITRARRFASLRVTLHPRKAKPAHRTRTLARVRAYTRSQKARPAEKSRPAPQRTGQLGQGATRPCAARATGDPPASLTRRRSCRHLAECSNGRHVSILPLRPDPRTSYTGSLAPCLAASIG